ncbi:MAG: CoA transferase, partial [Acidobacteria bacterium]|nr:CoA transferase [Acidobacteriota bacterium]
EHPPEDPGRPRRPEELLSVTASLPLDGLLVADFSRVLAGPLCTQLLADAGARVIKVEEPGRGDETRRWGPPFAGGISAYFLSINRNKESLTLNLRREEGRAIAAALIARAGVVIDNFLPAQSRTFALPRNGKAVHCTITGFDSDTPDADTPGYDLLAQAGAGLMAITGEVGGEPMKAGVALSDVLTAHHAHGAILAALVARERTGRGGSVEVSLFSSTLASLVNVAQAALLTGAEAKRFGNEHPSIVPYQLFHASDRTFALGAGTDRHFQLLCERVLERPELASDPRFATNAARVEQRATLVPLLDALFATKTAEEWVTRCLDASIPVSPVRGVLEALRSPAGQQLVTTVDHPEIGRYETVGNAMRFDGERLPIRSAPPRLGEQTDAILRELGYDAPSIERFRAAGIV